MPLFDISKIAFIAVAVILLAAVPGFILVKKRIIGEESIPSFSKLLLYVASPCLVVFSFRSSPFSVEKLIDLGIFALVALVLHGVMMGGAYLVLHRKYKKTLYRIVTVATTFGNCAFFGIPLMEALLPDIAPDLIIYTSVYSLVMNVIGWTVASAIISGDSRYVSVKKILINPTTVSTAIALLLFVTELPIYPDLENMIEMMGKTCTPLSMLIMGMRLATIKLPTLFTNYRVYLTIAAKQLLMPLVGFSLVFFLPVDPGLRAALFIISACPVASVVLNYSELVGEGQREAANMVLLGTMLSIVTLPIVMLLLPLLGV